jgi:quinol-cytochrome oxidoreductase complex cytochrome b subunit
MKGVSRARSILLTALSVEVAVLVVTGIALYFLYVPADFQAWGDDGGVRLALGLRILHRFASYVALPTSVAAGVLVALREGVRVRRWTGVALGVGLAVMAAAASVTGFLLPWDQLALWAVTVGTSLRGYTVLFDPAVRFVLVGGAELEKSTVIWWLVVHALVLGPALVALVVVAWRRHRRATRPRPTGVPA